MQRKWATAILALCVVVTVAAVTYAIEHSDAGTPEPAAQERPTERVSPPPEVNPEAVVWRTPEPPANPEAGDVWVNPKDGAEMAYVPAGEFIMGSSDTDVAALVQEHPKLTAERLAPEQPQFRTRVSAYWIDRMEVTNAQYRKFVGETGHRRSRYWEDSRFNQPQQPVVGVTWDDAKAYAEWAGKRLPTEMEWEKAARGTEGRRYPWGSQWPPPAGSGNFADEALKREHPDVARALAGGGFPVLSGYDDGYALSAPVGEFSAGASPYGALDMAGNVWEWCADGYDEHAYERYAKGDLRPPTNGTPRVFRGSCWGYVDPFFFRCAFRGTALPDYYRTSAGFRCARDAQ